MSEESKKASNPKVDVKTSIIDKLKVDKYSYENTILYLGAITILEFIISSFDFTGDGTILILMAIAKAGLVVGIFMHVKDEKDPKFLIFWVFIVPLLAGSVLILTLWRDFRGPAIGA